ncbi:hypothetical protein D3O17_01265 [Staphylococcus aureus]|nr:hypothetical protein D3O17_01265 [Staphylococcus aureus]
MLVRGPNIEAGGKSAYNNVQVGVGPQHRSWRKVQTYNNVASWGGAQTQKKFGFPISTDNASWGGRRNKFCENISF